MAEKKKAGVRVEPPEQVSETVQAPMTEATVAPEPRYSLQARVDRDIFHPVTATARQKLIGATVSAYHDALQQQEQTQAQTQKAAQSESPNAAPRDAPIMQM